MILTIILKTHKTNAFQFNNCVHQVNYREFDIVRWHYYSECIGELTYFSIVEMKEIFFFRFLNWKSRTICLLFIPRLSKKKKLSRKMLYIVRKKYCENFDKKKDLSLKICKRKYEFYILHFKNVDSNNEMFHDVESFLLLCRLRLT